MNFCTEALGTRVEVIDRVSEEGYEVTNLLKKISPTVSYFGGNPTGFMASRFVRPPITIRLDFQVPIHISHIVIGPKVGQQISTGFKIQVDISRGRKEEEESSLYQIAREFLQGPPFPETVVFRNPRFILARKFSGLPLAQFEVYRNFPNSFGLRHPTYNACERVFSLHVTIERAESPARVPVLGSIQIWGQPSKWVAAYQVHKIMETWMGTLKSTENVVERSAAEERNGDDEPSRKRPRMSSPDTPPVIPEDFLDPITVEIMCQPVRLPCGIAIDSKTLEKYSREEAKWGRLENDPFTGKRFTEDSRPVSDFSLKARIDTFLTQNANEIRVPRMLGTGKEAGESPHGAPFQSSRIAASSLPVPATPSPTSLQPQGQSDSNPAGKVTMSSKDFMEQELARILSSGPSFKPPPPLSSSADPTTVCSKCFQQFSRKNAADPLVFYRTGCNHTLVCRKCLIGMDKRAMFPCVTCDANWSPKDLTRIFT